MKIDDPELDARLAALYDDDNPWGPDDDFFLGLANRQPGSRVLDLGCGTGRLTTALARAGHTVMGIDPNPAFLGIARTKPGAELATWVRGTSMDAPEDTFDLALMTSHVAQELLTDDELAEVLADLHRALVPGGVLSFDSRDPDARAWETWASMHAGTETTRLGDGMVALTETTMAFEGDIATFERTTVESDGTRPFDPGVLELAPGTTWARATYAYRFRTITEIEQALTDAGFRLDHVYGGWQEQAVGEGDGELVIVATSALRFAAPPTGE